MLRNYASRRLHYNARRKQLASFTRCFEGMSLFVFLNCTMIEIEKVQMSRFRVLVFRFRALQVSEVTSKSLNPDPLEFGLGAQPLEPNNPRTQTSDKHAVFELCLGHADYRL